MLRIAAVTAILAACAAPALAEGDAEKGEKGFNKCKSCHMITDAAGEAIVKGGKTGPNLFGVPGRMAGTVDGFKYSKYMISAGEAGLVWDEVQFVEYVQDPSKFLKAYLGDDKAKARMTFKLKNPEDVADIWAFLSSVAPES